MRIRKSKQALVIIDMLNDFVSPGSPAEVPGSAGIVPAIRERLLSARARRIPVVYLCDRHRPDDPDFEQEPPHAVRGTAGAEIVTGLAPASRDTVIPKATYSGFFRTDLERFLKARGVEFLTLTGVCTETGVLYTGVDALMRGFEVGAPPECVRGMSEEGHRFALEQIVKLKPHRCTIHPEHCRRANVSR